MESTIIEYLKNEEGIDIKKVNEDTKYWLVRAQSGEFFDEFYENDYIGINWNEFSEAGLFSDANKEKIIEDIKEKYPDNKQAPHTFGQIKRFYNSLNIGDVVMVPNKESKFIAFGIIKSNVYNAEVSQTNIDEGYCPFIKRREVEWVKLKSRKSLDPTLFRMMQAHATISDASDYGEYIDRTMYSFYYKGDSSYLVLEVEQENDIPLVQMVGALNAPLELADILIDPTTNKTFSRDELNGKVRVQSAGAIAFISTGAAFPLAILVGVVIVGVIGGKIKFSKTKEKTEGEVSSDGLIDKIINYQNNHHARKMESIEKEIKLAQANLKMKAPNIEVNKDSENNDN